MQAMQESPLGQRKYMNEDVSQIVLQCTGFVFNEAISVTILQSYIRGIIGILRRHYVPLVFQECFSREKKMSGVSMLL